MDLVLEIFNYILAAILFGVSGAWIFLIKSMTVSFRDTPLLEKFPNIEHNNPKVSIILPARNEEKFIGKCLDSLLNQEYPNYEIIVIDDSSEDSTGKIIEEYAKKNSKIIHVTARPKPDDWMGKNWACMEGYRQSTGELLLCTDSDTNHSSKVISLAVSHLLASHLDALTVIPKMLCLDFWTKITLPMISTFLHTRFSAVRVPGPPGRCRRRGLHDLCHARVLRRAHLRGAAVRPAGPAVRRRQPRGPGRQHLRRQGDRFLQWPGPVVRPEAHAGRPAPPLRGPEGRAAGILAGRAQALAARP